MKRQNPRDFIQSLYSGINRCIPVFMRVGPGWGVLQIDYGIERLGSEHGCQEVLSRTETANATLECSYDP
jgi:hypothetical protein